VPDAIDTHARKVPPVRMPTLTTIFLATASISGGGSQKTDRSVIVGE
jgi:hypothetical protein